MHDLFGASDADVLLLQDGQAVDCSPAVDEGPFALDGVGADLMGQLASAQTLWEGRLGALDSRLERLASAAAAATTKAVKALRNAA